MNTNVNNRVFSELQGRRWNLTEVKNESSTINIDRTLVPMDIYTIKFETTHLTGSGAVNFYSAAYVARVNHTFSIVRFARIFDGALYEMEKFTEHEFFRYLERVTRWEFNNGKLELHTYDEYGGRVIMIFSCP
jgi:hypothetical protein